MTAKESARQNLRALLTLLRPDLDLNNYNRYPESKVANDLVDDFVGNLMEAVYDEYQVNPKQNY